MNSVTGYDIFWGQWLRCFIKTNFLLSINIHCTAGTLYKMLRISSRVTRIKWSVKWFWGIEMSHRMKRNKTYYARSICMVLWTMKQVNFIKFNAQQHYLVLSVQHLSRNFGRNDNNKKLYNMTHFNTSKSFCSSLSIDLIQGKRII
jgi:hypothetical protein